MGILDRLGLGRSTRDLLAGTYRLGLASPYLPTVTIPPMLEADLLKDELKFLPIDRDRLIGIPAVSKARNLLVATIAKFPLHAIRRDGGATGTDTDVTDDYSWLYRSDGVVTPYERLAWTVDDLIFYGYSLWLVKRGAWQDGRAPILAAEWCPTREWTITNGTVMVDEQPIEPQNYILINSPFEGLVNIAQRTLQGAIDIEESWVGRAKNPVPVINLARSADDTLTDDQVKALVDAWAAARLNVNGAVGSTPEGIKLEVLGDLKVELMIEGRNAIRTDVGSFLNVRVAMLDGTIGVDSLTYSTKDGEKNAFYEFDLPFWTDPITARLSMDDVVARGTRIRFDMYEAQNLPTRFGPNQED